MTQSLLPILLFAVIAVGLSGAMLGIGWLLGPKRNSAVKEMPYESGMDPIHDARRRFDVRFHLVAIAFLLFDVELLFLYPWAVANKHPDGLPAAQQQLQAAAEQLQAAAGEAVAVPDLRLLVFTEVMVFLTLLAAGLAYAWRKGVFRWR